MISEERYYLEEVKVNNQAIEVNDNTFTYIMVEGGLTIDATFKCKYNYTIGDSSSWEILEENNIVTFKSTTDDAQLMFNNIFFTKGTILQRILNGLLMMGSLLVQILYKQNMMKENFM